MSNQINGNDLPLVKAFKSAKSGDYLDLNSYLKEYPTEVDAVIEEQYWDDVCDPDLTGGVTLFMVLSRFLPTLAFAAAEYPNIFARVQMYADPNIVSDSGQTAAMFAAQYGNIWATKVFVRWEEVDWSKRSSNGMSAYDFAAYGLHVSVLSVLAEKAPQAVTLDTAKAAVERKLESLSVAESTAREYDIDVILDVFGMTEQMEEGLSKTENGLKDIGMAILNADVG